MWKRFPSPGRKFSSAKVVSAVRNWADDEEQTPKRAEMGLGGWIACYPESRLAGTLFCGGVNAPGDIEGNAKLQEAFEMGKRVDLP